MTKHRLHSKLAARTTKLALIATVLAFFVILLGAFTRLTNAGLSCPDWPNCYGYLTAPHTSEQIQAATLLYPETPVNIKAAWTEMTHRYFAGCEGLLILALAFCLFKLRKQRLTRSAFTAVLLLVLLCMQVTLGMRTVTQKLNPVVVLSHLLIGLSILSVLWWTFIRLLNKKALATHMNVKPWLCIALVVVAFQITLGGWVSTHYAGLACIDFPYCNGEILPNLHLDQFNTDLITIHMLHRIGALVTTLYISLMLIVFWTHRTLRKTTMLIFALLALQITLGILNLYWLRPVWLALMHHAVGILLLLSLIATLAKTISPLQDK